MKELTSRSTNAEIAQQLGKELATGKPIIYAIEETKNPEYTMLYVAQEVKGARQVSEADADFLGWDSKTIARCLRNCSAKKAAEFEVGDSLDGYNVEVYEDTTPGVKSDGSDQDQKQTPDGELLFEIETGAAIYRHTRLVKGLANHVLLQNQPIVRKPVAKPAGRGLANARAIPARGTAKAK